eukprot:13356695-Alexandrium_andersonii.AAC.1
MDPYSDVGAPPTDTPRGGGGGVSPAQPMVETIPINSSPESATGSLPCRAKVPRKGQGTGAEATPPGRRGRR